jgi:hypothetical protein
MTTEDTVQAQENHIPERARVALRAARQNALRSGHSVLVARQNQLVEVAPDGTTQVRKQISAPVPVVCGQKISRRRTA